MADISVTAANVIPGSLARYKDVVWGGTVTQGMPVYVAADGMYEACDCTAISTNKGVGIALTGGGDGQKGIIQISGNINLGATLAVGETYVCSESGLICPEADIASTEFVCILGIADTTSNLKMGILYTEVAHA